MEPLYTASGTQNSAPRDCRGVRHQPAHRLQMETTLSGRASADVDGGVGGVAGKGNDKGGGRLECGGSATGRGIETSVSGKKQACGSKAVPELAAEVPGQAGETEWWSDI